MSKVEAFLRRITAFYFYGNRSKVITVVAEVIAILTFGFLLYSFFFVKTYAKDVYGHISRYKVGELISYSGEITNNDVLNAEKLSFKGRFQSQINSFEVDAQDVIERKDFDNQNGVAQFILSRLSSGNRCQFDIIVDPKNDLNSDLQLSWLGGKSSIKLLEADKNLVRGIELGGKIRSLSESHNARERWIENNTKVIGASK